MTDNSERSPKLYLSEIILYIDKIEKFVKDVPREQFLKDEMRIYAVDDLIRNIGEAVRVLAKHKQIKSLFYTYRIPYDDLSDLRTDFTHEYFTTDKQLLWTTAKDVLPKLKPQFKKILDQLSSH
jgi:uncharacterized protein with HEPN domain